MISAGAKGDVSEEVRKSTDDASSAIELLTVLVNDLLDFQKLQEGKMQLATAEFELSELVMESIRLLAPSARRKNIDVKLEPGQWTVMADQSKLRQTFTNLLSNAIKFSPQNGTIWIDLEQEGGWTEVRVIDQGPGIPDGYEEKIFDAFEQVPSKQQKEGSGLGLAICKLIATAHGGATGVYSGEDGNGSVFWIRIPSQA